MDADGSPTCRLKYIDSVETETHIYIATEPVKPLSSILQSWDAGHILTGPGKERGRSEWLAWGIKSIATALGFINTNQIHALVSPGAVWVTPALEWKLGGFEILTAKDDPEGVLWRAGGLIGREVGEVSCPEVRNNGWSALRDTDPALSDTYLLATLIYALYNPTNPVPSNLNSTTPPQPSTVGNLPKVLFPVYKRMINPNAKTRLPTTSFITQVETTGYWKGNNLLELVTSLDHFELASESEKLALLRRIRESTDSLPPPFLTSKILPSLLHSLSLPSSPASSILPLVLSIGANVSPEKYTQSVLEPVVKLYASPDRGTRMALLEGLGEYGDKLDKQTVSEKIWPFLITGFADTVAVIREATVKSIPILAPKLNDRLLNNDLLRLLAKMQVDPEPSIRTNTCILLGRLAPHLSSGTKKKVLIPAFTRSLKDTFVHARVAGLMALMATVDDYDKEDLAGRVIPNMAFTMIDKEKVVRDQGFKAMQVFMSRLETAAAEMPVTVMTEQQQQHGSNNLSTTTTAQASAAAQHGNSAGNGIVGSAAGAAGALAGWAISSLGRQLPVGEAHSNLTATDPSQVNHTLSIPTPSLSEFGSSANPSPAVSPRPDSSQVGGFGASPRPASSTKFGATSKSRTTTSANGLNLGGGGAGRGASSKLHKPATSSSLADQLAAEFEDDTTAAGVGGSAWGVGAGDDLMDVNADDDDWSAFETAPTPMEAPRLSSDEFKEKKRGGSSLSSMPNGAPSSSSFAASSSQSSQPKPTIAAPKPVAAAQIVDVAPSSRSSTPSTTTTNARTATVVAASSPPPPVEKPATPTVNLANLSKEEKEAEMARRREERKAVSVAVCLGSILNREGWLT